MELTQQHDDWRAWFGKHGPRMLLVARLWTRSAADAEDALQEAFVRYWTRQRHLGGEPSALLVTSIKRAAMDGRRSEERRTRREQESGLVVDERESWFEAVSASDERGALLAGAVQRLPEQQREVLVLRIWGELSFADIAEQLELSPNTVASRYRYALEALRRRLAGRSEQTDADHRECEAELGAQPTTFTPGRIAE